MIASPAVTALDQALASGAGSLPITAPRPARLIAYLCRSSARHAVAWFAAPLSGRIACSLHVRETPERLGQALDWLDAKMLVHDADLGDRGHRGGRRVRAAASARISLGARGGAEADYRDIVAKRRALRRRGGAAKTS